MIGIKLWKRLKNYIESNNKMKKYDSINGLRTIAAIGIVMMHVLANVDYKLNNETLENVLKEEFTNESVILKRTEAEMKDFCNSISLSSKKASIPQPSEKFVKFSIPSAGRNPLLDKNEIYE